MTGQPINTQQRVVVGFDGSPCALEALRWAARQAELTGAELVVLSAWQWPDASPRFGAVLPEGFDPSAGATEVLDEALAELRTVQPRLRVRGEVVQGDAGRFLVDASRGATLLVVGSRGHGELVGLLIGSVSEYCAAKAHCPVVVVRGAGAPAAAAKADEPSAA